MVLKSGRRLMDIGKISESVLKRSVLKQIKRRRDEVLVGPGVGEDCSVIKLNEDEVFVISTDPITGTVKDIGKLAVHITANDISSKWSRDYWNYAIHSLARGYKGIRTKDYDARNRNGL
jgi:hydrogenase maturation factor